MHSARTSAAAKIHMHRARISAAAILKLKIANYLQPGSTIAAAAAAAAASIAATCISVWIGVFVCKILRNQKDIVRNVF
jgi:hypothetical protein